MMMKTLTIAFLVLALAHNAAASRLLKQQYSVPLLRGTAQPQQATPEYNRYGRGAGDLLQNVVQGETQRGVTDSQATVVLQTDVVGHQNAAVRDAVGQNQAQALVSGAANGSPREIAKEAFGNVQYQVHGQGLALNGDTRTALANNDAQRIIQASIDNGDAFTAAQGGSDNAFATVFGDRTHQWTN